MTSLILIIEFTTCITEVNTWLTEMSNTSVEALWNLCVVVRQDMYMKVYDYYKRLQTKTVTWFKSDTATTFQQLTKQNLK